MSIAEFSIKFHCKDDILSVRNNDDRESSFYFEHLVQLHTVFRSFYFFQSKHIVKF